MTAQSYLDDVAKSLRSVLVWNSSGFVQTLDEGVSATIRYLVNSEVIYLVGNGGSAAVVAHAQNDFAKAAKVKSRVFQDVPLLTAYANDYGYEHSQSEPLSQWITSDDTLLAVSSSGASPNILAAAQIALRASASLITFTGFSHENPLGRMGHWNFYVPSREYGQIELTHAALLHCLTDGVAEHAA